MNYEYISWDSIHEICFLLAEEIKMNGFQPNLIIGIARGGWPISRIMADILRIRDMKSIQIKSYSNQKQDSKIHIESFKKEIFIKKKILICEDIVDSGVSFKTIISKIRESVMMGGEVKTLALFRKLESDFTPDFFLQLQNNNWIIFPWEINEIYWDLRKTMSADNIMTLFYKVGIPESVLDKIVDEDDTKKV